MITNNIFLYHLDHELHKLCRIHITHDPIEIYNCFKFITRLAFLLSTESIIIPASNYFESDISYKIINELKPLNPLGVIKLATSSLNLVELLNKKSVQHPSPNNRYFYDDFRNQESDTPLYLPGTLITRVKSASEDIKEEWRNSIGKNSSWAKELYKTVQRNVSIDEFEKLMYSVPDLLGRKAFISEYIVPFLPLKYQELQAADTLLNNFITQCYIKSFLDEYDAMCFSGIPIIDSERILPKNIDKSRYIPYTIYAQKLFPKIIKNKPFMVYINECEVYELTEYKNSKQWKKEVELIEETIMHPGTKTNNYIINPIKVPNNFQGDNQMDRSLLITALSIELESLLEILGSQLQINHIEKDNRSYYTITPNAKKMIVCTSFFGMGQVKAALAIKDALLFMDFDRVILVGICGGLPGKLSLGDIVVSEKIVDYEIAKVFDTENVIRWNVYNSDHKLITQMRNFSSDRWRNQLKSNSSLDHSPLVHFGTVLSGNKVMASRDEAKKLAAVWDKALAIEMEASGMANALYESPDAPPFIMVKSVCDFADKNKNDDWQDIAAKTAALYVIDFLFTTKTISISKKEDFSISTKKNILYVLKETYNKAELNELCFNIDIDIENLGVYAKNEIAVELIRYCERHNKIQILINQINEDRDDILG